MGASLVGRPSPARAQGPGSAADALKRLKEGNRRFATGKVRHAHQAAEWRRHLTHGQEPSATILACSDSRVPPELVFDQGLGDLFVIRVAGNVIARDVLGSIQYAVNHLNTPLIVVMGHQGCGAVTAAVQELSGEAKEKGLVESLLELIEPGLKNLSPELQGEKRIDAAVEANVRWSIKQLAELPEGRRALEQKVLTLVGAVYELNTGRVRFLR